MVGWLMNSRSEELWKEAVVAYLKVVSRIILEGLRKTTKNLGRVSKCMVEIRTGHVPNTNISVTAAVNFLGRYLR
jgi:hypothetical protein